jgi:hypothetical protein
MPKKKNNQAEMMATKGYLSLNAVAAALGLRRQAVWKWADAGKVEHIRVAGHIYLEEKSLVAHVGSEACALLRVGHV